jgi:hypothetical protein
MSLVAVTPIEHQLTTEQKKKIRQKIYNLLKMKGECPLCKTSCNNLVNVGCKECVEYCRSLKLVERQR